MTLHIGFTGTPRERPILFSSSMIRAILDGRKCQTRRLLKANAAILEILAKHSGWAWSGGTDGWGGAHIEINGGTLSVPLRCPYGTVGDKLWVREEHYRYGHWEQVDGPRRRTRTGRQRWRFVADLDEIRYEAPAEFRKGRHHRDPATPAWHKRLARFMPRAASRITLEITDVRVRRLQEISASDACDEGALEVLDAGHPLRAACYEKHGTWTGNERLDVDGPFAGAVAAFATLWDSINHKRAPWASNPWVWALTFRRLA